MADTRGFLRIAKSAGGLRPVCERVADFKDVSLLRPEKISQDQGLRCMDCATPFCHWGCPLGNYIPEWNSYLAAGGWESALKLLEATNCMPEVTGRICPAPCEYSCVLAINDDAVTVRENELAIGEYGFKNKLFTPAKINKRTGKKIAVVGSGPAGLSCAVFLNRLGHNVTVFERDDRCGGILRYGIPDFKLEKDIIDRRLKLWEKEGIVFKISVDAGVDIPADKLLSGFDAVCLAGGSRQPRDLSIEGRGLSGIHFAMDYLIQANKIAGGFSLKPGDIIDAKGKKVVVIGGGDTGSDCVGVAHRQGAACVVQVEIMPRFPECRSLDCPWPQYPSLFKSSTSHEEGGQRHWAVITKRFLGEKGFVKRISCAKVEFKKDPDNNPVIKEIAGSDFEIEVDLAVLAVGFLHPEHSGLLSALKLKFDPRGNVYTDPDYMTSQDKVFSCGDMRRGQSLVVWAVYEGRECARSIDKYLSLK